MGNMILWSATEQSCAQARADAGVVRVFVPGTGHAKGVAISAGCNSRHVYLAPRAGTALTVAENYANLVAVGATPLAVTNCLNFGNPEKPEIMWQFAESIGGLGDACRDLETPVVSGNVSLYNETDGRAIKPTPMIAMVGLLDDVEQHLQMGFTGSGHLIAVVGELAGSLAGSEYLAYVCGRVAGVPTGFDWRVHKPVFDAVLAMNGERLLASAHDISDGGLAIALSESTLAALTPVAVVLDMPDWRERTDELLFGEAPARFVVSLTDAHVAPAQAIAEGLGVPFTVIGRTVEAGAADAMLTLTLGERHLRLSSTAMRQAYDGGFRTVVE